jgi:CCS family citrate carrier protein
MEIAKKKATNQIMDIKISGIPLPIYLLLSVVTIFAMVMNYLPSDMMGALLLMMILGGLFNIIGNNLPIIKTFLGGGAIVCIFASATLVYLKVIPENAVQNISQFMNGTGFLNLYIAALITGSILGMDRELLLKASLRFLPVALCAMTVAILMVGFVGSLVGYGFVDAIMYVAIPMMGGGMGAGVVPLSGMYAQALNTDSAAIISRMIPASTLGNVMAIVGAGMLAKLGEVKPSLTGNGRLMRNYNSDLNEKKNGGVSLEELGIGLITAMFFFLLGVIINKSVPAIHAYAWMIILVAASKGIGLIPKKFEGSASQWSQFVMKNWTSALLVGIGISMIDLAEVAKAISPLYLLLVLVVVVSVSIGAGIGGYFVGFYPIESAITAGLCTTNMGGTGDIAVLSSAKRMELLPFAQIATRICGALILIVASILIQILF